MCSWKGEISLDHPSLNLPYCIFVSTLLTLKYLPDTYKCERFIEREGDNIIHWKWSEWAERFDGFATIKNPRETRKLLFPRRSRLRARSEQKGVAPSCPPRGMKSPVSAITRYHTSKCYIRVVARPSGITTGRRLHLDAIKGARARAPIRARVMTEEIKQDRRSYLPSFNYYSTVSISRPRSLAGYEIASFVATPGDIVNSL